MKIDTGTILLIGVGLIGVYLITRPSSPTVNPATTSALLALQQQQLLNANNPIAADIGAGTTALEGLSSIISDFF